ncbi:hypothetical protein I4U23_029040 [Adineta vaga]|nr:hypothetical protein I4U23_029040 [Adineta vaga]
MYYDNAILAIKQIETDVSIPMSSIRSDAPGFTSSGSAQPTFLVEVNAVIVSQIISISVPNKNGESNVNQIQVQFYDTNGEVVRKDNGEAWIVETIRGVTIVQQLVPQIPIGKFEIKIISTTDEKLPTNITLVVIGCVPEQYSSTTVVSASIGSSGTPSANITTVTSLSSTTLLTGTTPGCVLGQWEDWSKCSPECQYVRTRYRSRSVISGSCQEPTYETEQCLNIACEECTITRDKYREQLERDPPNDDFVGYLINSTTLLVTDISIKIDDKIDRNASIFIDNCTQLACKPNGITKEKVPCLDDCKYQSWSEWSECNASCAQTGVRIRSQNLIPTYLFNPLCARQIIETLPCVGDPCPCIEGFNCTCDVTDWCQWSSCSEKCGTGQQKRTRQFKTSGNENCTRINLYETRPCNTQCCPVDGKYTEWSNWSNCSKSCDSGVQQRNRSCTNPSPSCKGEPCKGNSYQTQVCNAHSCEPNCTDGKIYHECANDCDRTCDSLTCDNQCRRPDRCIQGCICPPPQVMAPNGQCVDRKECVCHLPADGTVLINGESNIRDPCTRYTCKDGCIIKENQNCTVCEWSQWGPFTDCSDTCNGTQSRFRTYSGQNCLDERTEEDRRTCSSNCTVVCTMTTQNGTIITYKVGEVIEETPCNKTICLETGILETQPNDGVNIDGQWTLWADWTPCSQTCKGTRHRSHLCASPEPQCAGQTCMPSSDSEVGYITDNSNRTVLQEIQYENCNEICTTTTMTTTPATTSVTTPHTNCDIQNGTETITVPPQYVITNPNNPCEICTCHDGKLECGTICSENEKTCLLKQNQDPNYRYTWIPPSPGQCCGMCNKTKIESTCRLEILPAERIKVNDGKCISITEVSRERCTGGCESGASNMLEIGNEVYKFGNSTCTCCSPSEVYTEIITMSCEAIGTPRYHVDAKYIHIKSCDCKACES